MKRRAIATQVLRKALQLSVLSFVVWTAFGGPWRNYKLAHNHRRLVSLMEGDAWGWLYGAKEDLLSLFGDSFEVSLELLGFPWAARVFGLDTVDPLLAAALLTQGQALPPSVLWSLALPLGIAVVFGKFFCSHLCPMRLLFELGERVRAGLTRFGLTLPRFATRVRLGGWVLLGGLVAGAVSGTAVWLFLLPYVSLCAGIFLSLSAALFTPLLLVPLVWFFVDLALAPGLFCHNLCPTGFLLELVGRRPLFQLRKLNGTPCPTACSACTRSCPFGLEPKHATHTPACNNCGRCVLACPSERLGRRLRLPVLGATLLGLLLPLAAPGIASAHHNKGLPHYGYFENYPQVPTEEYVAIDGDWEIGATIFNFQGYERRDSNTPNDVKIYLYLYNLRQDKGYTGAVDFEIRYEGELVSRFDRVQVDEEAVYSTRETLPRTGNYDLAAMVHGQEVVLPFYVDIHSDAVNWWLVAGLIMPVVLVFALAWTGRSRRRKNTRRPSRGRAHKGRPAQGAALTSSVFWLLSATCPLAVAPDASAQTQAEARAEVCPRCGMLNCTMDHSDGGQASMVHYPTGDGQQVMVMGGMPLWLFLVGVGGVILLSFVATERFGPKPQTAKRLNLIRKQKVYRRLRSRWFQALPQWLMVCVLACLIYVGLFGSRVANLTPVVVWTLWWAGLVFTVLVLGSAWCFVCPWDGLANLVSRLGLGRRGESLSLALPFPKALANMYPAIGLFVVLTWLELGYGVTNSPRATAYMGLGMAACAVAAALLWEGKRFCAHMCPVGRICGLYSSFSPIEIRARSTRACELCETEECLHGNRDGYACPSGLSLKRLTQPALCTACTECIKSCDKHNVALNLRPFGADLHQSQAARADQAWLAVMLLSLTLFHGLSMTPAWENFAPGSNSILKWMALQLGLPRSVNFSLAMAAALAVPVLLYWLSCLVSARVAGGGISARSLFLHYSLSLVPVALFYHLAHNLMHLLMEGGEAIPLLSDPMGRGSDLFGTRGMHVGSLVSDQALWYMQVALILIGHIWGIVAAHRIGHRIYSNRKAAVRSLAIMPIMMIALSVCGLWLMHMDMNMRVGRM